MRLHHRKLNVIGGLWLLGVGIFSSSAFAQSGSNAQTVKIPIYKNGKIIRVDKVKIVQPQNKTKGRIPNNSTPFKFNGKTYYWMLAQKRK